jgi:hypothetical protein
MERRSQWYCVIVLMAAATGLGSCGIVSNDTEEVSESAWFSPGQNRAVVVVGVGIDAPEPPREFTASFTQFTERGFTENLLTGGAIKHTADTTRCWGLFSAAISQFDAKGSREAPITRYVFSVPEGHYAYAGLLRPPFGQQEYILGAPAFFASAGTVTYFGDFIYRGEKKDLARLRPGDRPQTIHDVELRRDLTAVRELLKRYRSVTGELVLAETEIVSAPMGGTLCTP